MQNDGKKWEKYDESRKNNQIKTIENLRDEIKEFEKREKAFKIHLKLKDNEIFKLKKEIKSLLKKDSEIIFDEEISPETEDKDKKENENKNNLYIDPLINSEFETIKKMIKEKDEILQEKLHEFEQIQTNQTNRNFKRLIDKCRALVKENNELYNYIQVGILENLKYENGLTKSQIDQLKLKLKEKEIVKSELEYETNQENEEVNMLNSRIRYSS
jgi:hypothetical protein